MAAPLRVGILHDLADGPLVLQSPAAASTWAGIWPLDQAGPFAVLDYLAAYGLTVGRWLRRRRGS